MNKKLNIQHSQNEISFPMKGSPNGFNVEENQKYFLQYQKVLNIISVCVYMHVGAHTHIMLGCQRIISGVISQNYCLLFLETVSHLPGALPLS